jgi:hypothetical protein
VASARDVTKNLFWKWLMETPWTTFARPRQRPVSVLPGLGNPSVEKGHIMTASMAASSELPMVCERRPKIPLLGTRSLLLGVR